jgi:hypothetical protein
MFSFIKLVISDVFVFHILSMNRHQNLIVELEISNFAIYVGLFLKKLRFAFRFICLLFRFQGIVCAKYCRNRWF